MSASKVNRRSKTSLLLSLLPPPTTVDQPTGGEREAKVKLEVRLNFLRKKLKYLNVDERTIRQRVYDLVKEVVSSRVKLFHCHIKGVTAA